MKLSSAVENLARGLAILGGLALVAITSIIVVSITGRALTDHGLGPLPGDFELVEALTAFAVFSFLPWCQLQRGHATVDVFTKALPERINHAIDCIAELLMTLAVLLIAWRLYYGMLDKLQFGETSFILQFPLWWGFAASLVAAVAGVVISLFVLFQRLRTLFTADRAGETS